MCTFLGLSRDQTREDVEVAQQQIPVRHWLLPWDTDNQKDAVHSAMQSANKAGVRSCP